MSDFNLQITDLSVGIGHRKILNKINLNIKEGELHILLGPNGCGKSSLLSAIMGLPPFELLEGEIHYRSQQIGELGIDERANLGIGMTFQRPPGLDGVAMGDFVELLQRKELFEKGLKELDLENLADRDVNVGFSGGEIKRWEVLKLFLQDPQLLLFDEPESGVDLEHIMAVGGAIRRLMQSEKDHAKRSALVITHTGLILDYIGADVAHMMIDGKIIYSGSPKELFEHIKKHGYIKPA